MLAELFGVAVEVEAPSKTQVDLDQLVLLSEALDWPVREAQTIQQVGRFALMQYIPVKSIDPRIILFEQGGSFNRAMRRFQEAREPASMRYWRQQVRQARWAVLAQLERLQPTSAERDFVQRWMASILAQGITAPHLFSTEVLY